MSKILEGYSKTEVRDIIISTVVLSMAFGLGFAQKIGIVAGFAVAFFIVGTGFILHELAHRMVARRFGALAEYRAYPFGLLLAMLFAVASNGSFVFAAPGAVYISSHKYGRWHKELMEITTEESGVISLVGPMTNLVLAAFFLGLNALFANPLLVLAASVNAFLALFNLLPVHPLDGGKVMRWDRKAWLFAFLAALIAWL